MTLLQDEYQIKRATDASMIAFSRLGIAIPDQVVYMPYTKLYSRADFSRVGDGYPTLTWVWDVLSRNTVSTFLELLNGNEYADVVIRCEVRDGTYPSAIASFKTFSAIMYKPLLSGTDGVSVARSTKTYQTVVVKFKKLIEL